MNAAHMYMCIVPSVGAGRLTLVTPSEKEFSLHQPLKCLKYFFKKENVKRKTL